MPFPAPTPGMVIRYSYLWHSEHMRGQEEGVKDRPCAIVMTVKTENEQPSVVVLPITHSIPDGTTTSVEVPAEVKRRLGLDDARSWVIISEANKFSWPGPDLRPLRQGDPSSIAYGHVPYGLFETIKKAFVADIRAKRAKAVQRTE
jgi:hypothetical protein